MDHILWNIGDLLFHCYYDNSVWVGYALKPTILMSTSLDTLSPAGIKACGRYFESNNRNALKQYWADTKV
jgi:hypothetical protein